MDLLPRQEALIVFPEYFPSFFQQIVTCFTKVYTIEYPNPLKRKELGIQIRY